MKVIITGGTGMVGSIVLRHCLGHKLIDRVISLVRRKSGINHPKLKELVVPDFSDLTEFSKAFEHIDIAYYCLGVYTGSATKEIFEQITVDFTKEFVDRLKDKSPNADFCYLSGAGADSSEKSRVLFARTKGIAENYILNAEFGQSWIFRPGYIYPVIKRKEPNFMYRTMRAVYPILKPILKNSSITSDELGSAIFKAGFNGAPKQILENMDIKKIIS